MTLTPNELNERWGFYEGRKRPLYREIARIRVSTGRKKGYATHQCINYHDKHEEGYAGNVVENKFIPRMYVEFDDETAEYVEESKLEFLPE